MKDSATVVATTTLGAADASLPSREDIFENSFSSDLILRSPGEPAPVRPRRATAPPANPAITPPGSSARWGLRHIPPCDTPACVPEASTAHKRRGDPRLAAGLRLPGSEDRN